MILPRRRPRLHSEHAEHAANLRVITVVMSWSAGIALGLATDDMAIAIILTLVITSGHMVSLRTRLWKSASWQLILLVPTSLVAMLLIPSLPQAFQGDWLHPMRYLLLLQALTSFYVHSRASLYTAQVLSGIVLLVSSQIAFDSAFLFFFFGFYVLQVVFLAAATRSDAVRGAVAVNRWSSKAQSALWISVGVVTIAAASLAVFLLLPWGSLSVAGSGSSMLPLTGQASEGGNGEDLTGPSEILPLSGPETGKTLDELLAEQGDKGEQLHGDDAKPAPGIPGGVGSGVEGLGGAPGTTGPASPLFGTPDGSGAVIPGDPGAGGTLPNPTIMQVRSPVATYWRGQTYSRFNGESWLPDSVVRFETPTRSTQARYAQTYFVKDELQNPVFGYTPLGWQPVGDTTAPLIESGDVYRVISERRNFHPASLVRAPGANIVNRGPDEQLSAEVKALAEEVTLGASGALQKSLAITQFLRSNYQHAAAINQFAPLQTMEQFLFGDHRYGNAFDFASAQTGLALAVGMEALTGYLPGELDPLSGTYVVRASDAHAWTEINFRGRVGWVPFDGNPREDGQAKSATSRSGAAGAVAGLFDRRVGDEVREAVKMAAQESFEFANRLLIPVAAGVAVVALVFLARWLIGRRRCPVDYSLLDGDGRRELVKAYDRLMKQIRKRVEPRSTGETMDQYFARVAREYPAVWQELSWLRDRLNEAAYRPATPSAETLGDARARLAGVTKTIGSDNFAGSGA
jgi:transglutaminase-like putative cysteine protease